MRKYLQIPLRNIAPREGTETVFLVSSAMLALLRLRNIAPREGTETVLSQPPERERCIKKYSSPRGDGNFKMGDLYDSVYKLRNIAPREGTETQCQNHDPEQQQD